MPPRVESRRGADTTTAQDPLGSPILDGDPLPSRGSTRFSSWQGPGCGIVGQLPVWSASGAGVKTGSPAERGRSVSGES